VRRCSLRDVKTFAPVMEVGLIPALYARAGRGGGGKGKRDTTPKLR